MEKDKKYLVFDAYVFGARNCLAYIRPLFLTGLIVAVGWIFFTIPLLMEELSTRGTLAPSGFISWDASYTVWLFELKNNFLKVIFIVTFLSLWGGFLVAIFGNYGLLFFDNKANQKVKFPAFAKVIKIMVAMTIRVFIALVGLICFIVPGIYWIIKTIFVEYVILDENVGVFDAFKRSIALTKSNGWILFAYLILAVAVASKFTFPSLIFLSPSGAYLYRSLQKMA